MRQTENVSSVTQTKQKRFQMIMKSIYFTLLDTFGSNISTKEHEVDEEQLKHQLKHQLKQQRGGPELSMVLKPNPVW